MRVEMKRLMLQHAFRFVESVIFLSGPENLRSRRAMEEIGRVRVGSSNAGGKEGVIYGVEAEAFAESERG